jgi:hypothetical protein
MRKLGDAYGALWLAIIAVILTIYLAEPATQAAREYEDRLQLQLAIENQAEVDAIVEMLTRRAANDGLR